MTYSAMSSSRNDPWGAFTDRLAQTLDGFRDGQFLILMISPVAAGAEGVMPYVRVELGGTGDQVDDEREVDVSLLSNAADPIPTSDPKSGPAQFVAIDVSDPAELPRFVESALQTDDAPDIRADADGVIALRAEEVLILVEAAAERFPRVYVVGLLAERVEDGPELDDYLNSANAHLAGIRLLREGSRVLGRIDVLVKPFTPDHMMGAVSYMAVVLQDLRPGFLERFGGRNFYGSRSDSAGGSDASDEGTGDGWTGGYL